ncbi:hypothetical protein M8818_004448 [Zalaria obscura]|uniref:Uncharacterized protein n=1 Tax=Zalaria obscura TaxID=2024903 RepID=A0ACC3SFI9_9PEZI
MIEEGVGITAGSAPALKPLIAGFLHNGSSLRTNSRDVERTPSSGQGRSSGPSGPRDPYGLADLDVSRSDDTGIQLDNRIVGQRSMDDASSDYRLPGIIITSVVSQESEMLRGGALGVPDLESKSSETLRKADSEERAHSQDV